MKRSEGQTLLLPGYPASGIVLVALPPQVRTPAFQTGPGGKELHTVQIPPLAPGEGATAVVFGVKEKRLCLNRQAKPGPHPQPDALPCPDLVETGADLIRLRLCGGRLQLPLRTFYLKGETDSTCRYDDGKSRRADFTPREINTLLHDPRLTVVRVRGDFAGQGEMTTDLYLFASGPGGEQTVYIRSCLRAPEDGCYFTLNWMQAALPETGAQQVLLEDSDRRYAGSELRRRLFTTDPWSGSELGSYRGISVWHEGVNLSLLEGGCTAAGAFDGTLWLSPHYDLAFDNARLKGHPREDLGVWLVARPAAEARQPGAARACLPLRICLEEESEEKTGEGWALQAGALSARIRPLPGGVVLSGIWQADERMSPAGRETPLFRLELRLADGRRQRVTSASGWRQVSSRPCADGREFRFRGSAGLEELEVTLWAQTDPKYRRIVWSLDVQSAGAELEALTLADLPLRPAPGQALFYPKGEGAVLRDAFACRPALRFAYPSQLYTMPFLALYPETSPAGRPGVFFAALDRQAVSKELYADHRESDGSITLAVRAHTDSTQVCWQLFEGDWYAATRLYGQWLEENAGWIKTRLHPRPEWFRDIALWLNVSALSPGWEERVARIRSELGVPVGVHLYHWHKIPFDNDYPHYFPAREGVPEAIRRLRQAGVRVMPYVNGRLWDQRDRGGEDGQFTAVARPAACQRRDGSLFTESYASREQDGSRVVLAVMCPSQPVWVDTLRSLVVRICTELEADGVYLDQIAAAPQVPCRCAAHGHAPGFGGWWVESYRSLMKELYQALPPGKVLTTESNAEPYADMVDGMLVWNSQYPGAVPAFPALYGDFVTLFGRAYPDETDPETTCATLAQQLVFGEQPGWFSENILAQPHFAFVREVALLRARLAPLLQGMRMCRPLDLPAGPPRGMLLGWFPQVSCFSDLQNGVFADPAGDRVLLILCSTGGKDRDFRVSELAVACGLSGQVHARLLRNGRLDRVLEKEGSFRLPARGAAALLLNAARDV